MRGAGLFILIVAASNGFVFERPPSRVLKLRSTLDEPPPHLKPSEQQAELMKKMGYKWDSFRRCWSRGTTPNRVPVEAKSGGRSVRFVVSADPSGKDIRTATDPDVSPAVGAAVARFQELVQSGRTKALQDVEELSASDQLRREIDGQTRNLASLRDAPAMWLACQLTLSVILALSCSSGLHLVPGVSLNVGANVLESDGSALDLVTGLAAKLAPVLGVGIACGLAVAALERKRFQLTGSLPREGQTPLIATLADAECGAKELGAPWDWRVTFPKWVQWVVAGELVAAVNVAVLVHAGLQASLEERAPFASQLFGRFHSTDDWFRADDALGSAFTAYGALFGVAALAALGGVDAYLAWSSDGVEAEVLAAKQASRSAAAHFKVTPPPVSNSVSSPPAPTSSSFLSGRGKSSELNPSLEEMAAEAVAVSEAAAATQLLAEAWGEAFGPQASEARRGEEALLAALVAAAYAATFTLSSGALLAPLVARAVHLADRYALDPNPERCRVNIELARVDEVVDDTMKMREEILMAPIAFEGMKENTGV